MKFVEFKSKNPIEYEYIAIRDITDKDLAKAAGFAGIKTFKGFWEVIKATPTKDKENFICYILSEICLFDGKKHTAKDLQRLSIEDLGELVEMIGVKMKWQEYKEKI